MFTIYKQDHISKIEIHWSIIEWKNILTNIDRWTIRRKIISYFRILIVFAYNCLTLQMKTTTWFGTQRSRKDFFIINQTNLMFLLYVLFENVSSIELNMVLPTLLYACRSFISFACIIIGELREIYYRCPIVRVRDVEFWVRIDIGLNRQ